MMDRASSCGSIPRREGTTDEKTVPNRKRRERKSDNTDM